MFMYISIHGKQKLKMCLFPFRTLSASCDSDSPNDYFRFAQYVVNVYIIYINVGVINQYDIYILYILYDVDSRM